MLDSLAKSLLWSKFDSDRYNTRALKRPKEEGGMPASNNVLSWNYWASRRGAPPMRRVTDV